ncbi:MAG: hypothetical protein ACJAVV_003130 [Alphaproteobacteria bacterium]|jgi:hypothetical protein
MMTARKYYAVGVLLSSSLLAGCMAKDITFNDQQKRMQRCDQYIDRDRDLCLRGDHVTIEDYKEDFRDYTKSKQKEADKAKPKLKLPIVVKPVEGEQKKPEI